MSIAINASRRRALSGMVGGTIGAYLTALGDEMIRPFISGHLLLVGHFIL